MLAVKFYEDDFFKNTFYAKLGGIPNWEMNCLEVSSSFIAEVIPPADLILQ
jgi:hypothetical protein